MKNPIQDMYNYITTEEKSLKEMEMNWKSNGSLLEVHWKSRGNGSLMEAKWKY